MTLPAWIYARFSTQEQSKGASLDRQLEAGRAIIAQHGWDYSPEREIKDEGRSAFRGANRAEGSELHTFEQKAREGHFSNGAVLVVENLDRLTRQGYEEAVEMLRVLTASGVTIATTQDNQLYQAYERIELGKVIQIIVKAELARDESAKKSVRVRDAWERKVEAVEAGSYVALTRMVPAWIDVDVKTRLMTLNPHRTRLLNDIYDWYIEGRGITWIIKHLNQCKVPTWKMTNNLRAEGWNTSSLHKMLGFRAVLGEYEPKSRPRGEMIGESKGRVIPNYYPQAVTTEKFNQAQAVRTNRQRSGGATKHTQNNLFVGIVKCGACGGPAYQQINTWRGQMKRHTKRNGEAYRYKVKTDLSYLRCGNWRRSHGCENSVSINYGDFERAILGYFFFDAMDLIIKPSNHEQKAREAIAEQERSITHLDAQLANIVEALAETPVKALAQKAASLEAELEAAQEALANQRHQLAVIQGAGTTADNIHEITALENDLSSEDDDVRYIARVKAQTALKNIIEKVTIYDDGVCCVWFKDGEIYEFVDGFIMGGTMSYYADM